MGITRKANISEQHDSYRKGLVLGLTMAEMAVLIIFILLLALAVLLGIEQKKSAAQDSKLLEKDKEIQMLNAQLRIIGNLSNDININSILAEMAKLKEENEANVPLKKRLRELKEMVSAYKNVLRDHSVEPSPEALENDLERMRELEYVVDKLSNSSSIEIVKENKKLTSENKRLLGQLANAQEKLKSVGRGGDMPSCWATSDGAVEYIFDVALTDSGIMVRESKLPHRKENLRYLPTKNIVENKLVSEGLFITMTLPIYQWSVKNKCRFYVRVFDETGSTKKDIYKHRLKTVEGHFYRDFRIHTNF